MSKKTSSRPPEDSSKSKQEISKKQANEQEEVPAHLLDPQVFHSLSKPQKNEILFRVQAQLTEEHFEGPLPDPKTMHGYNAIDPNIPMEIIGMAKNDQNHIHQRDNRLIDKTFGLKERGQNYALAIVLIALIGGFVLIALGKDIIGSIFSGGALLSGIVSQFLGGQKSKKPEKSKKEQENIKPH